MKKSLKKVLAIALVVMLLCGIAPMQNVADFFSLRASAEEETLAASGQCGDNVYWSRYVSTLTISGTGDMWDYDSTDSPFKEQTSIYHIIIEQGVTSVGNGAFYGCRGVRDVTLGSTVTTIGDDAFYECYKIQNFSLPGCVTSIGDRAFLDCWGIEQFTFNSGLVSIGENAFGTCMHLTNVSIPDSVTSIGTKAFEHCSRLTAFTVGANNQNYSSDANGVLYNKTKTVLVAYPAGKAGGSFTIPNTVTQIGDYAFSRCFDLNTVIIPDSVTSIGTGSFWSNGFLYSIDIPDSVTSIGDSCFEYCENLSFITIPDSVTTLGDDLFNDFENDSPIEGLTIGCDKNSAAEQYAIDNGIDYVYIDAEMQRCGENAYWTLDSTTGKLIIVGSGAVSTYYDGETHTHPFKGDRRTIKSLCVDAGITSIGSEMFENCISLQKVVLPGTLTSIEDHAFHGCYNMNELYLPKSLTSIGSYAFVGCTRLSSPLSLPNSLAALGSNAFDGCNNITSVSIPGSVSVIGSEAFVGCSGLRSASLAEGVTTIGDSAFQGCTKLHTFTIPSTVTTIGNYAFNNTAFTTATIPASVTSIGWQAFGSCQSLGKITVDSENQYYSSGNYGELFNKDKSELIQWPIGKNSTSYTIPSTVTTVKQYAFYGAKYLRNLTISSNVQTIEYRAFYNCTALTNVEIANGLTSIEANAFYGCSKLASITIPYTVQTIESGAIPTTAKIYCYENTAAHQYAQARNMTYELLPYVSTDLIRSTNATVTISSSNITLTAVDAATQINLYPALTNGIQLTFTNLTGNVGVSKNGTVFARNNATAVMTLDGLNASYNVSFVYPQASIPVADNVRYANATATVSGTTITLTPAQGATQISFYPTLKDGTALTFTNLSGGAGVSKNGTLYAKGNGSAVVTIGGTAYTIVFDFGSQPVAIEDNIRYANATATVSGTTITLTPAQGATTVSFYPTLKDGSAVAFSDRTGGAAVSKSGTLYSKGNGSATATACGTAYTIVFAFPQASKPINELIRTANANVSVSGTTITLTAINASTQISLYPTTTDGDTVAFSNLSVAKVSKSGTCYAKANASCEITVNGDVYTVNFVF